MGLRGAGHAFSFGKDSWLSMLMFAASSQTSSAGVGVLSIRCFVHRSVTNALVVLLSQCFFHERVAHTSVLKSGNAVRGWRFDDARRYSKRNAAPYAEHYLAASVLREGAGRGREARSIEMANALKVAVAWLAVDAS